MTLADRMIVMNNGVAEQVGTPHEVYHNPATIFVGGFIGSPPMNFLAAEIKQGAVHLKNAGPIATCSQSDQMVTVGLRPEHLRLCEPGAGMFDSAVRFTEALGAETLIHLRNRKDEDIIVRMVSTDLTPEPGAVMGVAGDPEHVFLFNNEGRRLIATLKT